MSTTETRWSEHLPSPAEGTRWRTRDITVAAVLGVVFGVVFWGFGVAWKGLEVLGPAINLLYGVWLLPAVLAASIVRRPGAALFTELVAATLSALLGSQWGPDVLLSGFLQGAAAELVFAFTLYRAWTLPVLAAASLASAAAAWVHDWVVWFPSAAFEAMVVVGLLMGASAVLIIPAASLLLVRALHRAGVLEGFPA